MTAPSTPATPRPERQIGERAIVIAEWSRLRGHVGTVASVEVDRVLVVLDGDPRLLRFGFGEIASLDDGGGIGTRLQPSKTAQNGTFAEGWTNAALAATTFRDVTSDAAAPSPGAAEEHRAAPPCLPARLHTRKGARPAGRRAGHSRTRLRGAQEQHDPYPR